MIGFNVIFVAGSGLQRIKAAGIRFHGPLSANFNLTTVSKGERAS